MFELMRIINLNDEDLLQQLQNVGLVRRELRCPNGSCRRKCSFRRRENAVLGTSFFCFKCSPHFSVLKGSFLENCKFPIRTVLFLMWEWVDTRQIVIEYYRFFRDICPWELLRRDDLFIFGKFLSKF